MPVFGHGLGPTKRQAVIWTNVVYWRIYCAPHGLDEMNISGSSCAKTMDLMATYIDLVSNETATSWLNDKLIKFYSWGVCGVGYGNGLVTLLWFSCVSGKPLWGLTSNLIGTFIVVLRPQIWLTFGHAPLNIRCFLAYDRLCSFRPFTDKPMIGFSSNLVGKLIMGRPLLVR